jgi:hypothetical protein
VDGGGIPHRRRSLRLRRDVRNEARLWRSLKTLDGSHLSGKLVRWCAMNDFGMDAVLTLAERCDKAAMPDQSGCYGPLVGLLKDCAGALRASQPGQIVSAPVGDAELLASKEYPDLQKHFGSGLEDRSGYRTAFIEGFRAASRPAQERQSSEPDYEAAARALGFEQMPSGKWWHPRQSHFTKLFRSAQEIFDWWGRANGDGDATDEIIKLRRELEQSVKALKEVRARTYSTDRRCRLDYEPVAEICDIATSALEAIERGSS